MFLVWASILIMPKNVFGQLFLDRTATHTNLNADNYSLNTTGSPTFLSLDDMRIKESSDNDIPTSSFGSFYLNAPAGWKFKRNTGTINARGGRDINSYSYSFSSDSTKVLFNWSSDGSANERDEFRFYDMQIICKDGANVNGNVYLTFTHNSGTNILGSTLTGGTVSLTTGALKWLVVTLPGETFSDGLTTAGSGNSGTPSDQTVDESFVIQLHATDQYYNIKTNYDGNKNLNYSGPGTGSSSPTYTTAVNFNNGVSTTTLNTTLTKAETTTITAKEGSSYGKSSSSLTVVNPNLKNFRGQVYMDLNISQSRNSGDQFGTGGVRVGLFQDNDSDGVVSYSDLIEFTYTNWKGNYYLTKNITGHVVLKTFTGDYDTNTIFTTDTSIALKVSALSDSTIFHIGMLGPRTTCIVIGDGNSNSSSKDQLFLVNRVTGSTQYLAETNTYNIEAVALMRNMDTIYATDNNQFGWVDIETGTFTKIGSTMGSITGKVGGSNHTESITDVDGLTYDAVSNILWGTERRSSSGDNDLLFQISRTTGQPIEDAFGPGIDFLEIKGTRIMDDVDDIALDPTTNIMYAVNNKNNGDSSRMITINMNTGIATLVGANGVDDIEGMGYYNDGHMYGTSGNSGNSGQNKFYQVSRTNGMTTYIGDMGGYQDLEGCDCFSGMGINMIAGTVFYDEDVDGKFESNDTVYSNIKVTLYLDKNNNGIIDAGDQKRDSLYTNSDGTYAFQIDSQGRYLTQPSINGTIIEPLSTTTTSNMTEEGIFKSFGQFDLHNDFGFNELRLGDKVWRDDNKDGVQDAGEPGVAGVVVTLYKNGSDGLAGTNDDKVVATTITDAYGKYLFTNLMSVDQTNQNTIDSTSYNLGFTLPPNYEFTQSVSPGDNSNNTNSDANVFSGRTGSINLDLGESDLTFDAGIVFNASTTASVGDRVWLDLDNDGVQDSGEPGVSNVTVTLYNAAVTNILASTKTDANGNYLFNNVSSGDYRVRFSLPPGTSYTTNSGGISTIDNSDAITSAGTYFGMTSVFSVNDGDDIRYVDAGLKLSSSSSAAVGDYVWYDNDRDGVQDDNEPGIAGVEVRLLNSTGSVLQTTFTDNYGYYVFNNLTAATYGIQFVKPSGLDFTTQNVGSQYNIDSDPDVSTGKTANFTLTSGQRNMTIDAGMYSTSSAGSVGALGDFVWNDVNQDGVQDAGEPGIAGVGVVLYNNSGTAIDSTATDENGFYLFPNLSPGNYSVGFYNLPSGYQFTGKDSGGNDALDSDVDQATGKTASVSVTGGSTNTSLDAGLYYGSPAGTGSIGNRVWYDLPSTPGGTNGNGIQDAGESGVAGLTVELLDGNGNSIDPDGAGSLTKTTTVTNALGEYIFTGLNAGNYIVQFSDIPSGFSLTTANSGSDDRVDSDGAALGTNGAPTGASRTGVISLSQGEDDLSIDLGIKPASGTNTLGDFVWHDLDKDGMQDTGEPGVPGVTVNLLNSSGVFIQSTTTDKNGHYLFAGLTDGTYKVEFKNLPDGLDFTVKSGTNDNTGSDADPSDGITTTVTIGSSNRNDISLDAGLIGDIASLGDFVWNDLDKDGIQDSGEPGIAGVTVTLYASNGTDVLATTITDENGKYLFPNLSAGTYVVGFGTTPILSFTTQDASSENLGTDSDVDPNTGKTASVVLTASSTNLNIDAGLYQNNVASIGNYVWSDLDNDGVQDAGENGIGGVLVTLYNSSNVAIGSAITNGDGYYLISNVPPGTGYYLVFSPNLPGFDVTGTPGSNPAYTTQNVGTNGTNNLHDPAESNTDSDVTASGGNAHRTATFNLAAGDYFMNIDAGIINAGIFAPLPVKWLKFNAILLPNQKEVALNWATASEINNSHFELERSFDAVNFNSFGRVNSKAISGNSIVTLNYDYLDLGVDLLGNKTIYYRLKQVDYDGEFEYSQIRKVTLIKTSGIVIYPSPVNDVLTIEFNEEAINTISQIQITDMMGKVVYEKNLDNQIFQSDLKLDVSNLPKGFYNLYLFDNRTSKVVKFLKQ
ncbi:MAG: T9SS type A sorting domain-containing protein [Flavobacteriales bacterium]|nr:T9SS type A sorting domain-containing protein [Flavobacteriales bacterium]